MKKKTLLLVNPWITDFAAHDLWVKPLGLLYIASMLKRYGYHIHIIDCLARWQKRDGYGRGKFFREETQPPEPIANIPRPYYRFGITQEEFERKLQGLMPDFILVSSGMTYWYPGLFQTIKVLKEHFPRVPVVIGGRYVTLFSSHARAYSGADYFVEGEGEIAIVELLQKLQSNWDNMGCLGNGNKSELGDVLMLNPSYEDLDSIDSIALLTSRGCPFNCSFCASPFLFKGFRKRAVEDVFNEILFYYKKFDIKNFAFYDDALIFDPDRHIKRILRRVIDAGLDIDFHTPNGLAPQYIDRELASLMLSSNFKTVRLSLESSDSKRREALGKRLSEMEFMQGVDNLVKAGYNESDLEVYLIMGLPQQDLKEVRESIIFLNRCGVRSRLASYSPIPFTGEWNRSLEIRPEMEEEPLLTNNSIFPIWSKYYEYDEIQGIKSLCSDVNGDFAKL